MKQISQDAVFEVFMKWFGQQSKKIQYAAEKRQRMGLFFKTTSN